MAEIELDNTDLAKGLAICKAEGVEPTEVIDVYGYKVLEPDYRLSEMIVETWAQIETDVEILLEDESEVVIKIRRGKTTRAELAGLPDFEGD
jgi:hypothetical protein